MDTAEFSYDELVKALEEAKEEPENPDGVLTTGDLFKITNLSRDILRKRLRVLKETGTVVVGRKKIINLAGNITTVPGYKLNDRNDLD